MFVFKFYSKYIASYSPRLLSCHRILYNDRHNSNLSHPHKWALQLHASAQIEMNIRQLYL